MATRAWLLAFAVCSSACADDFATRVVDYDPAPGQFVRNPDFNDPAKALGPPIGGGLVDPDLSKLVALGGFGGAITLAFDRTVLDHPRNPMALDAIVFGNAFWVGGDPTRRFAECAHIEISLDANQNGLADDPWFLIPGSHITDPQAQLEERTWDDDPETPTPPENPGWIPPGRSGQWTTRAWRLPPEFFETGSILVHPDGPDAEDEFIWGYADLNPVLKLGDTDADDAVDEPGMAPGEFYTVPDDPRAVGVTPGSGGGDAFDIAWAIDPATGEPANLPGFDFIRITVASDLVSGLFGEISAEIGGVADVRPVLTPDWNLDGLVNAADVGAFLSDYFLDVNDAGLRADYDRSGVTNTADVGAFLTDYFREL